MRLISHNTPASSSTQASTAAGSPAGPTTGSAGDQLVVPNTARARESAAAAAAAANRPESRAGHLRRTAHQGRLHGYAIVLVALIAVLVALVATNTARVHVDWLVGSSRVSLVWLVLVAAIIGWILGVLVSVRFQWVTRAPRRRHQR
jgi:uncharacterized integral membrane protein